MELEAGFLLQLRRGGCRADICGSVRYDLVRGDTLRDAVQQQQGTRDVVIDLFAGYESLADECIQRGLTYVAVDIVMRGKALAADDQREEGDVGT